MYGKRVMHRRLGELARLLVIVIATVWLVGCGGPSTDVSTPATGTPNSVSSMPSVEPDGAQQEDTISAVSRIEEAIRSHIEQEFTRPYKDITVRILTQDDAFATAEVRLFMRKSETDTWQEYVSTYKLRNVSGRWRVAETSEFVSALAPQMTATAQAERESKTTIVSIQMLSSTEGWAVGSGQRGNVLEGSVVLKYSQTDGWKQVSYLPGYFLNGIFMESDKSGWAVGERTSIAASGDIERSAILRFDGNSWNEVDHPRMSRLMAVTFVAPDRGWAVGEGVEGNNGILQFDGTQWQAASLVDSPDGYNSLLRLQSISIASPTLGFAVGNYNILKLRSDGQFERMLIKQKGNNWGYDSPMGNAPMRQVYMVSADEAYAVGGTGLPGDQNAVRVLHYEADQWTALEGLSDKLMTAYDLHASSPQDIWIVGSKQDSADYNKTHSAIMHYSVLTGKWEEVQHPDIGGILYTVRFVSPGEGWAAGWEGQILHYKDGMWSLHKR